MPKKRKYETAFLMRIIEEYVSQKAAFRKLKYTDIVLFCKEKYLYLENINYQDFSRNSEIRQFVEDYNIRLEKRILDIDCSETIAQDRLIDARDLYGKTDSELDRIISSINEYLIKVYENDRKAIRSLSNKNERIKALEKKNRELEERLSTMEVERTSLKKNLADSRKKKSELQEKVKAMLDYIEKTIYDPTIQSHFVDIGILTESEESDTIASTALIETSLEKIVSDEILTQKESEALDKLSRMRND